ncbi:hypothetical protein IWW36_002706 [Coemansia brasiliensis]|uniref:Ubiquitin carboxyl-terminal hydrolase n=1 Tax=Coemansia brasiliensis TaxID=2650707 RepID=A0A9W8IE75_9FUNG|nr:hypothetical protein IWW36_002706 [Coemansia brasiliensis]
MPSETLIAAGSHVDALLAKQGKVDKLHLRRRVEFRLAVQPDTKMDQLRKKYKPINDINTNRHRAKTNGTHKTDDSEQASDHDSLVDRSGFRRAAHSLFPAERLSAGWRSIRPIGPGLNNLGNTCFLNSVLQCLTYTAPLAEYMLAREHSDSCRAGDNCMLCKFELHVGRALSKRDSTSISPKAIVGRLKLVAKHMRIGRQEDAHEFLRLFIDAFQRSLLTGVDPKVDRRIQETTLTHQIFGGYLQSQVSCSRCGHDSNTFDPLLDISLDIHSGNTIQKALRSFTRPESLSKGNRYKCESCKRLVDATKQMTVYQLPRILTLQLKRFSVFGGGKINRYVEFPLSLDMKSYISKNSPESGSFEYNLYAVLVHSGGTCRSGHYYCFVKSAAGVWYELNDSMVRQVSQPTVLKQTAYMLFYERSAPLKHRRSADNKHQDTLDAKLSSEPLSVSPAAAKVPAASEEMETALGSLSLQTKNSEKKKKKKRKHKMAQSDSATVPTSQQKPSQSNQTDVESDKPKVAEEAKDTEESKDGDQHKASEATEPSEWIVREKEKVPVISWDEKPASKYAKATAMLESKRSAGWNVSDVRADRTSQYGAQVESWNGTVSALPAPPKPKKHIRRPDSYDSEYDRGRVKKVKKNKHNRFAATINPFQILGERVSKK